MAAESAEKPIAYLCLLGLGNANKAFLQILHERLSSLPFEPQIAAVVTGRSGWWSLEADGNPLDLPTLLGVERVDKLAGAHEGGLSKDETCELIRQLRAKDLLTVVVEAIPTNYSDAEPAYSMVRTALEQGASVVSANKAHVALACSELQQLAKTNGCHYLHESACMDGIPIFNLVKRCLPHARIRGFEGILNSTTNVILESFEQNPTLSFQEALKKAQDMGIAEAEPSGDIDGYDAAVKCVCLARAWGLSNTVKLEDVTPRDSISHLSGESVCRALPKRFKVVCRGEVKEGACSLSVRLELISPESPLYSVGGASSCVTIFTDVLGPMTLVQSHPTTRDTGYGLFADLCAAVGGVEI